MKKDSLGGNRMKAIAIVEVPEGGEGKWYIDGEIRYTENESLMMKFDKEMIPLKPLPNYRDNSKKPKDYAEVWIDGAKTGWNACLDEITGETE